ncbi:MAG: DNA-binding protein [Bacteroidaceae bacterium]|nr:DNA-binding protein [Bacteroidaceae bacterium]
MGIKVKAVERNVSFDKNSEKWAYVLQPDLYSKLSQSKVIQEAALRSGISKGAINAAWDAIGEVIKAWATEGHSVAIPGLGSMRFGLRSTSVADVNKVGAGLITSRRVIFSPNQDIKKELAETSVSITCYDRYGNVVKRVTSTDDSDIEDPEDEPTDPTIPSGGGSDAGVETPGQVTVSATVNDESMGSVTGTGTFAPGESATLIATANEGYRFVKWEDGVTDNPRNVTVGESDVTYTAIFEAE